MIGKVLRVCILALFGMSFGSAAADGGKTVARQAELSDGTKVEVGIRQSAPTTDASWLIGAWRMRFDPDGGEPDTLVFEADGTGHVLRPDGRQLPYGYRLADDSVTLVLQVGARTIELPMQVSHERSRLTNSTGAYYARLDSGTAAGGAGGGK